MIPAPIPTKQEGHARPHQGFLCLLRQHRTLPRSDPRRHTTISRMISKQQHATPTKDSRAFSTPNTSTGSELIELSSHHTWRKRTDGRGRTICGTMRQHKLKLPVNLRNHDAWISLSSASQRTITNSGRCSMNATSLSMTWNACSIMSPWMALHWIPTGITRTYMRPSMNAITI